MKFMRGVGLESGCSCNNNWRFCVVGDKRKQYRNLTTRKIFKTPRNRKKRNFEKTNSGNLSEIAELLVRIGINQFQFVFVRPTGSEWSNCDSMVPMLGSATPHIRRGLQIGIGAGAGAAAEGIPSCRMCGYANCIPQRYTGEAESTKFYGALGVAIR